MQGFRIRLVPAANYRLVVPVSIPRRHRSFSQQPRRVVLTLILSLAAAAPTSADLWYQHYQKAQNALANEDWELAVEELNQAIERRGDSGARVRTYGMRTTDYFPYMSLGFAYLQLGQPDAALQAFETEERLGAIAASNEATQELAGYRELASAALAKKSGEERQRIRQILAASMQEARRLADDGELEQAMAALSRGLAVAPEDAEAEAFMEQLRQRLQRARDSRDREARIEKLVTAGSRLLGEGAYGEAATNFREALGLAAGDPSIQALLDQAQRGLREQVQPEPQAEDRAAFVRQSLAEVGRLESAQRLDEALELLQTVLAVQPDNPEARSIEDRLIAARATAQLETQHRETVATEMGSAAAYFAAGRFEEALSAANRALAAEPANPEALEMVASSYREISRVLLGRTGGGNIPPAIRFADLRKDRRDGTRVQVVREPRIRLTGMVIDNSPVEISFSAAHETSIPAETRRQQLGDFYLTEFQVETELTAGMETIRLVATDAENLSSSSEYTVLYLRPWYRSPWSLGLLATGGLGLVAGILLLRKHRRQLRRRRRFNPYVAGAPVLDENLFFGRDQLIDRILQTIHNNSLLLYGERRIGKTSIQHHLRRRLQELEDPSYRFFPVYVDLQGTPEERFFATIAEDVFHQLEDHLQGLEVPSFDAPASAYSYRDLVRDLRRVLNQLQAASSKRVKLVLLMDEVDELNEYDPRVNQRLRSLFMKSFAESLVAVVSGVEIKKHWERVGSPWYNFFEEIEVEPLDDAEARNLIERPIAGVLKVGDGVAERIIELTGGRPYPIQKLCVALVSQAYESGRTVITVEDVKALSRSEAA